MHPHQPVEHGGLEPLGPLLEQDGPGVAVRAGEELHPRVGVVGAELVLGAHPGDGGALLQAELGPWPGPLVALHLRGQGRGEGAGVHRAPALHEHRVRGQAALLVVLGHVPGHPARGVGVPGQRERLVPHHGEAHLVAVGDERHAHGHPPGQALRRPQARGRHHRVRAGEGGLLDVLLPPGPVQDGQAPGQARVLLGDRAGEQDREQRLGAGGLAQGRRFHQEGADEVPGRQSRDVACEELSGQARAVGTGAAAGPVGLESVEHQRVVEVLGQEAQQPVAAEGFQVLLEPPAHHVGGVAGDLRQQVLGQFPLRIAGVVPPGYRPAQDLEHLHHRAPGEFLGLSLQEAVAQPLDQLRCHDREPQRHRAHAPRRPLQRGQLRGVELRQEDGVHAVGPREPGHRRRPPLAASSSSRAMEHPRASLPCARPCSTNPPSVR